jgi:hypothetical protein
MGNTTGGRKCPHYAFFHWWRKIPHKALRHRSITLLRENFPTKYSVTNGVNYAIGGEISPLFSTSQAEEISPVCRMSQVAR